MTDCMVCGASIPDEYNKHDKSAPVYADDGVYHKGCEGEVFNEVFCSV